MLMLESKKKKARKKEETHEETKSTEETVRIDKQGKTKKRNPLTE